MHKIWDEFEFRPDRTTDYGVSCPWASKKISHRLIIGKCCLHASSFIFDQIIIKVAGNQDRHKSAHKFDFGPDQTSNFGVTCPWMTKILHFRTLISLMPVGQSWSNFMYSITGPMPRLIWVIAGHTLILLVLTCHGSNVCECDVGRDVCRAVLTAVFIIHRKGSRFYDHINTSVQYRTCSNSIFSFIDLCGWWNIKKVIIRLTLIS